MKVFTTLTSAALAILLIGGLGFVYAQNNRSTAENPAQPVQPSPPQPSPSLPDTNSRTAPLPDGRTNSSTSTDTTITNPNNMGSTRTDSSSGTRDTQPGVDTRPNPNNTGTTTDTTSSTNNRTMNPSSGLSNERPAQIDRN